MEMNQFDHLVKLVLEGRSYDILSDILVFPAVLLLLVVLIGAVALTLYYVDAYNDKKELAKVYKLIKAWSVSLVVLLVLGATVCYTSYRAASYPTMNDAKLIVTYKVGEQVVNSPKFQELVDKAVDAVPVQEK